MTERDSQLHGAERNADDGGFASRWSRLKQQSEDASTDHTPVVRNPEIERSEPLPELTDQDMPPLDSLSAESDFSPFLSPKVSESLHRLALRKLFHGDSFNVCDGLDDYAEDFTRFSGLGSLVTADMQRQLQRQLENEERETGITLQTESEETLAAGAGSEPGAVDDPAAKHPSRESQPAAKTGAVADDQDEVEII